MSLWCCGRRVGGWVFVLCVLPSLSLLGQEEGEEPVLSQAEEPVPGIDGRDEGEDPSYVYDPADKRDPFLPTLGAPPSPEQRCCTEELQTPLQSYEMGQLRLVGIIWNLEKPRALVEDGTGTGYIVTRDTPIGSSCGKVKIIEPGQLVIEEYYYDLDGDCQPREVIIELVAPEE